MLQRSPGFVQTLPGPALVLIREHVGFKLFTTIVKQCQVVSPYRRENGVSETSGTASCSLMTTWMEFTLFKSRPDHGRSMGVSRTPLFPPCLGLTGCLSYTRGSARFSLSTLLGSQWVFVVHPRLCPLFAWFLNSAHAALCLLPARGRGCRDAHAFSRFHMP
jgi:hypothetical protein